MTPIFEDDIYPQGEENRDDKKLVVMFYLRPVINEPKSLEAGRKIFDEIEYIKILVPGQRDTVETEVTEQYRQRFAERYRAWKSKGLIADSGTPISELTWLSVSQKAELQAINLTTLEQLAGMSDATIQRIGMGGQELKARAQRYVDAGLAAAPDLKLEAKLKERDEQIAELKELVQNLSAQVKAAAKTPVKA